jgi:hypothetical protein
MEQSSRDNSARVSCPKCQTVNPAVAKFCSTCGAPLQEWQQTSQPPPAAYSPYPPPQPPSPHSRFGGTQFGGGNFGGVTTGNQATVNLDAATAFQQTIHAIQSVGGEIDWGSPPQSPQFTIRKKSFWVTCSIPVCYHGELSVSPLTPQQSMVRANVKVKWSTTVPVLILSVVSTIVGVFLISLSIYDYDFAVPFVLLLGLGSTAYLVWHLGIGQE